MKIKKWHSADGDPWATLTKGHVCIHTFAKAADIEPCDVCCIEHTYVVDRGGECNHHFCKSNDKGAFPVTVLRH